MAKPKAKTQTCPTCNGAGVVPWATEMVICGNCAGSGKIKA